MGFLTGQFETLSTRDRAINAATSWAASVGPTAEEAATTWIAKVPASPTKMQAEALSAERAGILAGFTSSYQSAVYLPYATVWNNQTDDPGVQQANAAVAEALAVFTRLTNPIVNDVLRPAIFGMPVAELEQQQEDEAARDRAVRAAWDRWLAASKPMLAELEQIGVEGRTFTGDTSARQREAESIRDSLERLALIELESTDDGGPAWLGVREQRNLARAREQIGRASCRERV